jgi:hypothetical protein
MRIRVAGWRWGWGCENSANDGSKVGAGRSKQINGRIRRDIAERRNED